MACSARAARPRCGGPEPESGLIVALDGLYHEEHALPEFVHARSRDQLRLPNVVLEGETPVIYFYTQRPQSVGVDVRFPQGIWMRWYLQAKLIWPKPSALPRRWICATAGSPGRLTWSRRRRGINLRRCRRRRPRRSGTSPAM
ncbi:MAG: hypothetical protein IRY99_20310 [Isosphaeraceae bacterium]|nr:hypothetical protein [Isosphaeraceae bacterium]